MRTNNRLDTELVRQIMIELQTAQTCVAVEGRHTHSAELRRAYRLIGYAINHLETLGLSPNVKRKREPVVIANGTGRLPLR